MAKPIKKLLPKSDFARHVLTLMTGTGIAQALPLLAAPIISRLYTQTEVGTFTLFLTLCNIVGVAATGRYELAVVLPEDEKQSANLVALSSTLALISSVICLLIGVFLGEFIAARLHAPEIQPWLPWVSVAVFITAVYQTLNYWFNRRQQYRRLALNRVSRATCQTLATIGLGFQKALSGGLIWGQIIGQGIATLTFSRAAWREDREIFRTVSAAKMIESAKRYRDFPRFAVPADGLNSVSSGLPSILLSALGQATVGQYGMVLRVLGGPLGIVAGSFADVFKQRASRDYNQTGTCRPIWRKTFLILCAISLPFGLVLVLFAPPIFAFVLGEPWRVSGQFAQALAPLFMLQFVASPLSRTLYVAEKQRFDLVWQIGLFVALLISLRMGVATGNALSAVRIYGFAYAAMYVLYLGMSYQFAANRNWTPPETQSE